MAQDQPAFDLLGLPQEIILQIIEQEVQKEDLDNFVLCSKTIFTLASRVLAKHREIKKKYSTFVIGDMRSYHLRATGDPLLEVHPVVAVSKLLADHAFAQYCKILKVGQEVPDLDGAVETRDFAEALTSKLEPHSQSAQGPQWTTLQPESHLRLAWVVPFIDRQNIEVLELADDTIWYLKLDPIVRVMRNTHHRLKEVRLFGQCEEGYADMKFLCQFATIPSVQIICGHHVQRGGYKYRELCPDGAYLSIEEIHLECSYIAAEEFEDLLSHTKALRVFFYEQGHDLGGDYQPRRTLEALRKYGSESLQSLTFIDPDIVVAYDDKTGVSLRDFKVLTHVAIDCFLFVDPEKYYDIAQEPHDNGVLRLVDILPQSLQTLEMYRPPPHGIRRLFEGLAELREERLPNLKSITLHKGVACHHNMRRDLKKLGIELAFATEPKWRWPCPERTTDIEWS
ncbi:MAG: hypothetical protein LQ339_005405 [Xanthoria mediterranea]|nr:MAG: hypothetical protein LQ339_005405 [Xanthoria mediterranea]